MPAAELVFETLRLHPRLDPDDLVRAWARADSRGLYALADFERGAMWLLRRLEDLEAEAAAPDGIVGPLRRHVDNAIARNLLLDAEAAATVRLLEAQGVPVVLLRGVARRAGAALFPCGDARTTSTADLMVPADASRTVHRALEAAGYEATTEQSDTGGRRFIGEDRFVIAIHTRLAPNLTDAASWSRATDDARTISWNGLKVTIPAPTELLWHGLTEAMGYGTTAWRLRFFLDAASILAGEEPVAWDILGDRLDRADLPQMPAPRRWLDVAAQLAGTRLPPGILGTTPPVDFARILRWRISVLGDKRSTGFGGRLLEEGLRRELGVGVAPRAPGTGLYRRTRRRLGGLAARIVYGVWTATGSRPMRI